MINLDDYKNKVVLSKMDYISSINIITEAFGKFMDRDETEVSQDMDPTDTTSIKVPTYIAKIWEGVLKEIAQLLVSSSQHLGKPPESFVEMMGNSVQNQFNQIVGHGFLLAMEEANTYKKELMKDPAINKMMNLSEKEKSKILEELKNGNINISLH